MWPSVSVFLPPVQKTYAGFQISIIFPSNQEKKKADISQRVGFLISDIVHSSGGLRVVCKHGGSTGFICCNLVRLQTAVLQKLLRAAALTWWRRPPAWRGFTAENNINSHPRSARRIKRGRSTLLLNWWKWFCEGPVRSDFLRLDT